LLQPPPWQGKPSVYGKKKKNKGRKFCTRPQMLPWETLRPDTLGPLKNPLEETVGEKNQQVRGEALLLELERNAWCPFIFCFVDLARGPKRRERNRKKLGDYQSKEESSRKDAPWRLWLCIRRESGGKGRTGDSKKET